MQSQSSFSPRELQIIPLLVQGKSNKEIALTLGISVRTVEFHLSNLYAKLGSTSRLEAALKLTEMGFGQSTGVELRESTAAKGKFSADNKRRRLAMKTFSYILGGLLALAGVWFAIITPRLVSEKDGSFSTIFTETSLIIPPPQETSPAKWTDTPAVSLTLSPKAFLLEQIRQKCLEYDRAVQAEHKHGEVEFRKDPESGEMLFYFKGESQRRIEERFQQFLEEKTQLEELYTSLYRAEMQPTPFPTQPSSAQNQAYYEYLTAQQAQVCSLESWQEDPNAQTLMVYDPEEGRYRPIYYGDVIARCEVYGKMIEELRTVPLLARVNHDEAIALIRHLLDQPSLSLTFQGINQLANAPQRNAALYLDEIGTKYYIDIETARLAGIEPDFPTHPEISAAEGQDMAELRRLARRFALASSTRLTELESTLLYEEGCKENICFFRWDTRQQDWLGTDWARMPPFLQVGLLRNGELVTYVNTLDLY